MPLGSIREGGQIGPTLGGPELLVSLDPDCRILPMTGIDTGGLEFETRNRDWADFVSAACSDPASQDAIRQAAPVDLAKEIGRALATEVKRRTERDRNDARARGLADSEIEAEAYLYDLAVIAEPTRTPHVATGSDLVGAVNQVGHFSGFRVNGSRGADDLPALADENGLRVRKVRLPAGWVRDTSVPFVAYIEPSEAATEENLTPGWVALIPDHRGYRMFVPHDAVWRRVTSGVEASLGGAAWEIAAPLPQDRALRVRDLARRAFLGRGQPWVSTLLAGIAVALLGLLTPLLTDVVLQVIIPKQENSLLFAVGVCLGVAALLAGLFATIQSRAVAKWTQQAQLRVQPALWDRTLAMPARFFRDFSSGELATRVLAGQQLAQLVSTTMVSAVLAAIFGLVNFGLLFHYSTALALTALIAIAITIGTILIVARSLRALARTSVSRQREANSWMVQLLSSISKIRMAGAESRLVAFHQTRIRGLVDVQARETLATAKLSSYFVGATELIPAAFFLTIVATMWGATGAEITSTTYVAFLTAFGTVFAATSGFVAIVNPLATIGPTLDLARPILESVPEPRGHPLGPLRGDVEFRHVSFRYSSETPFVVRDFSARIRPGSFVAFVGSSGSGKSSLLRLLLGFERPEDGQVLIDGRDLCDLDLHSYRSQLGAVVQDGRIMQATVRENICGADPADDSQIWAAAKSAALEGDLRQMPMGLDTYVDPSTVSGGQAQRILLARALLRKPRMIVLDEATSALDNRSQAEVSESLANLAVTRIVVAHRLSTVEKADLILVVEEGELVEGGTFDDLMSTDGKFAKFARRQMSDS